MSRVGRTFSEHLVPRTPGGNAVFPLPKSGKKRGALVNRAIKARFREVDKDRNGMLDVEELSELLRQGNPTMTDEEVQAIFELIDSDGSGRILFDEFVDFLFMPGSASQSSSSSSSDESDSASSASSAHSSGSEAIAKATREARRVSAACGQADLSALQLEVDEVARVELSGALRPAAANGRYTRREPDWVVTASNGTDEAQGVLLNGRPIYTQDSEETGQKRGVQYHLFYGWTRHWGRRGQTGWFVSHRLPEDQEPVEHYLLINPCVDAETPDLCRALWETATGLREKRLVCEAVEQRASRRAGKRARKSQRGRLLDEELWGAARPGGRAPDAWEEDLDWEWRVEPGEESWPEEPEAEPGGGGESASPDPPAEEASSEASSEAEAEGAAGAAAGAAGAAAGTAGARGRGGAARRRRQRPLDRKLLEDQSLKQAPGFHVVLKQDRRLSYLERSREEAEKKRLEEERRARAEEERRAAQARLEEQKSQERARAAKAGRHGAGGEEGRDGEEEVGGGSDPLGLVGKSSTRVDGFARLPEMHQKPSLFTHIVPDDILCEASAKNRWFLGACAAVAEYPAWIQAAFGHATRLSLEGRYCVRLYHPGRAAFVHVSVDDRVPTCGGSPAFAGITGAGDIWVALMEKAFAKLCGSYRSTEGGAAAYGLLYLCGGGAAESWRRQGPRVWRRARTEWHGTAGADRVDRRGAEAMVDDGRAHGAEELWAVLRRCRALCRPMLCGAERGACSEGCGLQGDRPYSLLGAAELPAAAEATLRMVRLRDLLGAEEWRGRWSNGCQAWEQNPAVRAQLQPEEEEDGGFWMSYSDFLRHFDRVDFAQKSLPVQGCCRAVRAGGEARLQPGRRRSRGKAAGSD